MNVGEVGGEVCTRGRMCSGGWEVWVHGDAAILYNNNNNNNTENSHIGHCTHTSESTNVKVQ